MNGLSGLIGVKARPGGMPWIVHVSASTIRGSNSYDCCEVNRHRFRRPCPCSDDNSFNSGPTPVMHIELKVPESTISVFLSYQEAIVIANAPFCTFSSAFNIEQLLLQLLHDCHELRHHPILAYREPLQVKGGVASTMGGTYSDRAVCFTCHMGSTAQMHQC